MIASSPSSTRARHRRAFECGCRRDFPPICRTYWLSRIASWSPTAERSSRRSRRQRHPSSRSCMRPFTRGLL